MFKVTLEALMSAEEEFNKDYRQLDICINELERLQNALSRFSYMDEPIWQLKRKKDAMRTEYIQLKQVAIALENIQNCYYMADKRAEEYCEDQTVKCLRMAVGYQNFEKYDRILNNMNLLIK